MSAVLHLLFQNNSAPAFPSKACPFSSSEFSKIAKQQSQVHTQCDLPLGNPVLDLCCKHAVAQSAALVHHVLGQDISIEHDVYIQEICAISFMHAGT